MENIEKIQHSYVNFILSNNRRPHENAELEDLEAIQVENYYQSFFQLEKDILFTICNDTVNRLVVSKDFSSFELAREKVLLFLFTWIESLTPYREFLIFVLKKELPPPAPTACLKKAEDPFKALMDSLIAEGVAIGEIVERPYISSQYSNALWQEARMILQYWIKDKSDGYENTDALIEKTINFTFDMMQPNALDSGLDLLKFMLKR